MKALFLAGGMGTRLKPLTNDLPKPMVPVMGKPLLERSMLKFKDCGIDEIILSTCYKSQCIEEYFGDGANLGLKIHYACEDTPLGTGGAIKNAEEFFNDTFIIYYADILSDINIRDMIKFHKVKHAAVTIAVTQVENYSAYGVIEYNEHLYAQSFIEKPKLSEIKSNYINAGIYIFEPNILKEFPKSKAVSLEREVYPLLLKKGYSIAVYKSEEYWIDIGTIEKYIKAHQDILSRTCPLVEFKDKNQNIFIGKNTIIHPSTKIIGPVYIGENTIIGAHSIIGPNTIIGNNCRVGINNTIVNSIVWDKLNIQKNFKFTETIHNSDFKLFKNITNTKITETRVKYESNTL